MILLKKLKRIIRNRKINDIQFLNKYFENMNKSLELNEVLQINVETYNVRRNKIINKYICPLNYFLLFLDTIFVRIAPKLSLTKKLYFKITKGRGRVLSKAETLGRLYSCGFELVKEEYKNDKIYFTVKKVKEPEYDMNPSYGFLIKLNRIGYKGKKIEVYKFRTMRPYSEYLQEYIYKKNQLKSDGKIKDDFRISPYGKILRKFWLDELPMIINLIRGEMKIVGVRPLSEHYFSLYSKELQSLRIKSKPGLIPPFYVDLPKNLDEIMESELKYLNFYMKNPLKTDFIYFFRAIFNILFRRKRSS